MHFLLAQTWLHYWSLFRSIMYWRMTSWTPWRLSFIRSRAKIMTTSSTSIFISKLPTALTFLHYFRASVTYSLLRGCPNSARNSLMRIFRYRRATPFTIALRLLLRCFIWCFFPIVPRLRFTSLLIFLF